MVSSLKYCVLFGMEPSTKLMPLSGGHIEFLPQTPDSLAVGHPRRDSVISGGKYMVIFNKECSDLPSQTSGALFGYIRDFNEVLIPVRPQYPVPVRKNPLMKPFPDFLSMLFFLR